MRVDQCTDDEFENIDGEPAPYLPEEGIYVARFGGVQGTFSPVGEKLKLVWTVFVSSNLTSSIELYRHYNVYRAKGGRRRFSPNQDFWRDWTSMNNGVPPRRGSSLALTRFKSQLFFVDVVTVKQNGQRKPLNPSNWYSKVGGVIRPLGEGESVPTLPIQLIEIGWKKP
jgi:hypothetical protein